MESSAQLNYYLQVVKSDEKPTWPRPEEELVVGMQNLDGGFIQYWAYPKELNKSVAEKPLAEVLAVQTNPQSPAVLIDQSGVDLQLVIIKDGHAWGKTDSNLENLEDNLTAILEFAKNKFNINIEHFMTTENVTTEVEEKLNDLEKGEEGGGSGEIASDSSANIVDDNMEIKNISSTGNTSSTIPTTPLGSNISSSSSSGKPNKLKIILPVALILLVLGVVLISKDRIFGTIKPENKEQKSEIISTPTITPTPTSAVDRSKFSIRILNGTTKTGAAATLSATLKEKGWVILSTGNASNSATPQSYVRAKNGLDEAISTLISDLSGLFEAASSSALLSSDKADLEVVIGLK